MKGPNEPPAEYSSSEALEPLSAEEAYLLRRYLELAEKLKQSRFFHQRQEFKINISEAEITSELPHGEDEELVIVMLVRLRNLADEGRPGTASFPQTLEILRSHIKGRRNPSAEWLHRVLDNKEARVAEIKSTSLIGLYVEREGADGETVSEAASPEETFLDWLYGVYLHADEERLARVEFWRSLSGAHEFNFLQMADSLSREYYGFTGIVKEVLDDPALVSP